MEFAPDGRLFVLEQDGTIEVYQGSGNNQWTQLAPSRNFFNPDPLTVNASSERGLLGIAFDPDYRNNHHVYVYYTATSPAIHNRISRFTAHADGTRVVPNSEMTLMDLENLSAGNHNGGAMHFGLDNMLYVAVGDNANSANSQSITTRLGKILRLNPDPADPIPSDNPTSMDGIAGATAGNKRSIWAVGLRNPYTFAFKPGTSTMYINDVGQSTWEEINVGAEAANYGWGDTEGPFNKATFPQYTHPIVYYHHNQAAQSHPALAGFGGQAITGGAFYVPDVQTFPVGYAGDYFFADYVSDWIKRFDPGSNTVHNFASNVDGPVDLKVGPGGALYYLARNADGYGAGRVMRVRFDVPCPADIASAANGQTDGQVNLYDLLAVFASWGPIGGGSGNPANINGDHTVDSDDVEELLDAWGPCL
jgi:glucose/arabinose dehydrogenase